MAIARTRTQWLGLAAGLVLLFIVFPLFLGPYPIHVLIQAAVYIIAALGLNILTGYAGQLSLGHAGFVAVGAYTSGILASRFGVPFWLALPAAAVFTGLVGLIFGTAALRIKGFYLIVSTLAAQFIIVYTINHLTWLTGGDLGLEVEPARLGGFVFDTDLRYYFIIMTFLVIATLVAKNLVRSKVGRAFVAVRDNDLAAEVMGVNVARYKLLAFFIGCLYAGAAGSLWAHWIYIISPAQFTLWGSIWYVGYIVVGGMGTIVGPFFGVAFLTLVSETVHIGITNLGTAAASVFVFKLQNLLFGIIIILSLIFQPRGLAHLWGIFKTYYRLWPFRY